MIKLKYFISKSYQNMVEETFLSKQFPWYYNSDSISLKSDTNVGFTHLIFYEESVLSSNYQLTVPILTEALAKADQKIKNILRIRAGMFTRNLNDGSPHDPHIDRQDEHTTLLYYVNDSDGPTKFWKNGKVIKEVIPRKGTAVLFPFGSYHSSSCPVKYPIRVTLNYNFLCTK